MATKTSNSKTHRSRLQTSIKGLQEVYDEVGYLRDHSTAEMQNEYNKVREYLPLIWKILQKVDDKLLPDALAQEEL
jgi:hypothetical protein